MTGRCECGRVQFEIGSEIEDYSHCHCSQCRRLHGAAYVTFAGVKRDGFRYTSGEADIGQYSSSKKNDRVFCTICGSSILVIPNPEPDMLYVAMGVIDGNPPHPPAYHIFVKSKAEWHDITDDAPMYGEYSDEYPGC